MYNRNQVSLWGTKTKVQFWYQYRSRFVFLMFSPFQGNKSFYKLENDQILKNNLKLFNIWQKFGFGGPFMIEKILYSIVNQIPPLKCGFSIGYGIG